MYSTMKKRVLGFTLLELMVAISIAAILIALAVPSFTSTIKRNRVQSQARGILSSLLSARAEAVSRGGRVTLCHINAGACDGAWSSGMTVFTDTGIVGQIDGNDVILHEYPATGTNTMKAYHYVGGATAADSQISFNNRGEVISAGVVSAVTFVVCDVGNNATFARAVLLSPVGQTMAASAVIGAVSNDVAGNALVCP